MSPTVVSHILQPRRAFHSTLSTTIVLDHAEPECRFFALYSFPQNILIDRYELEDRHLPFEFWGESNLELPVFALNQTAKSLLLVHATPTASRQVVVDIPVHARYGEPGMSQSLHTISISSPACFWACSPSARVSSPFSPESPVAHSTMLGSMGHFSIPTVSSYHALLQIPVASKHDLLLVETGTTTVVLIAFLWLVYCSWRVANTLQACHLKEQ